MDSPLDTLSSFVSTLTFAERKALITLARSQSIPDPLTSPILYSKTQPILDRLVASPPFERSTELFTDVGGFIIGLIGNSLLTGIVLVYALGVELSEHDVLEGKLESFNKELLATQTVRRPSEWNWNAILDPSRFRGEIVHPLFPSLSPVQRSFSSRLHTLRNRYRHRVILPHFTNRGISKESATLLEGRTRCVRRRDVLGPASTYFRYQRLNVSKTSRHIVHHYIRTGEWIRGKTQLKQRWYPSGLLPRTYFAWGGSDIAASSYLRVFFNDLADCFDPCHRKLRVQPDYLGGSRQSTGGFSFYDLTSFTSWFHEHVPFLNSLAECFDSVSVFLSGPGLTLEEYNLGSLIRSYTDLTTDFAEFIVSGNFVGMDFDGEVFRHMCAGFLGIPGNLVTCTIPHGLALGSLFRDTHRIQVPGDDVGFMFDDDYHQRDVLTCAGTLGVLQVEKVFSTPGVCLYLKRLVLDLGDHIDLAPMLIYPLLPYLLNPISSNLHSNRFRLPKADILLPRAARVLVSFHRDLWNLTRGTLHPDSADIILLFLKRVHSMVGLPFGSIFQGRLFGSEDDEVTVFHHIPVKFSVDDIEILYQNPDLYFSSRFITRMTLRSTGDVSITPPFRSLKEGQRIIVHQSKAWSYLENMGYVRILGIAGEKIDLIGQAARDAYLFASEPPLREVEVLDDIDTSQLVSVGILDSGDSFVYDRNDDDGSRHVDLSTQSWRYRRYVDLDDVKSAGFYGRSEEWVREDLARSRSSLSPEPLDCVLDY